MEFVGFSRSGDGVGEFGRVDGGGSSQAGSGYVGDAEKLAFEAGDLDFPDDSVFDVCEEDAFGAGAGDVFEGEAIEGFCRVDAGAVDEYGDVGDFDVGEAKVFDGGNACVAGDGVFAHEAGVEDVEAEEAASGAGDFEVGGGDVFDEGAAARA